MFTKANVWEFLQLSLHFQLLVYKSLSTILAQARTAPQDELAELKSVTFTALRDSIILMAGQRLLVLAFMLQVVHTNEVSEKGHFNPLSSDNTCTCPDDNFSMTYECTVIGGATTIWRGSAISKLCANINGQIILLHYRFMSDMNTITCGDGNVVGQGVKVENNDRYTSLLTISSNNILGESIVCAHNLNGTIDVIGNTTIELQTAYVLSVDNVHISAVDIGSRQLGFTWSPAAPNCLAIYYNILASNCGSCPTTTNHTTATCTDVPINGSMCLFMVQPVVCGYASGNSNYSLTIDSTKMFTGTHSNKVSLLFLILGVACLVISVSVIVVCSCFYATKIRTTTKPDTRSKNVTGYDISLHNGCNTTQNENRDACEYSELEEIPLELKSLLKKLQGQVSKQWYQFGLALGLPMDVLEGFNLYSEEDCLVEVLDYWLKHHPSQPTWQEITNAQSKIENFNTTKDSDSVKITDKNDTTVSDIPPPKPPRRSSSVTARNSTTLLSTESKNDCEHEYECVP